MSEPQIVKNADSYDLDTNEHMDNGESVQMCPNDTREQLEADISKWWEGEWLRDLYADEDMVRVVGRWLDRQAIITERELIKNARSDCDICGNDFRRQCDEMRVERNKLSRDLTAEHALVCQLEDDNERMRGAIDAMGCGQFYAIYRAKCEECEQLKKVVRTQAESFKKLECELAGKDG